MKPLLNKNISRKDRDENSFYYHLIIGSLSYLAGCIRLDIPTAVYHTAKFLNNPKVSYNTAIKRIEKYLLGLEDKVLIYKPDMKKALEVSVGIDFTGGFDKSAAEDSVSTYSRPSFLIKYTGCSIIWKSKL